VQSRLVALWPPGAAILLTSTVFALVHFDPQHVVAVLPIGLYLGWAAWRSGSVWLSMLLHALNNLAAVLLGRLEAPLWSIWAAALVLGWLGFLGARRLSRSGAAAEAARLSLAGLQ
jgi:membrane protease YdiL (CAAX protease family)